MIVKTLLLAATAAAAAAVAGAVPAADEQQPAEPRIVYSSFAMGLDPARAELYAKTPSGMPQRLTENRVFDGFPRWSPDRRRIVFVRATGDDSDIWVMNADGTNARRLAGSRRGAQDLYPAWSPNGRLIAFASNRFGENELFVMRPDGRGLRRLTRTARWVDDTQPTFSPDSRFVLFASNRVAFSNYELYRARVSDGRVVQRLTFWGSGGDLAPGDDLMPEYSPDGRRIAWVSDRQGGYAIWTMSANGRDLRRVVRHNGLNLAFPRYSADGATLLYSSFVFRDTPRDFRLRTVPVAGGQDSVLALGSEGDW